MLLRYPEQLQGPKGEFKAQMEAASFRKLKDWRTLHLQYLLKQNRSLTGEDKPVSSKSEVKRCGGTPLVADLALMMRINLIFGLREFVTVVYGPTVVQVFPDIRVEAYRHSGPYVNLVSVVDCSVLNWVEQGELRRLASDNRLFGKISDPGWVLMDLNNSFKCRMGGEDLANVQFNPKLWNLRPIIKGTTDAVKIPAWSETYAHVKENQDAWLAGSNPLPNRCPLYPRIRRMLLGVNSPALAPRIGAAQDVEGKMIKWSEGMEPRFISWSAAALHGFDFTFPDLWSRKKIKAIPSRRPEVSAGHWNDGTLQLTTSLG